MAQSVPLILFHGQALKMLADLNDSYRTGVGRVDDLVGQLRDALTAFERSVGTPLLEFDPVAQGEPPVSPKMNRLYDNLSSDINLLQRQVDVVRAAAIFSHNMITTEVMRIRLGNARVANKLKTLQVYSRAVDSNVMVFGDHFRSEEFLDVEIVPAAQRSMLLTEGYITLAPWGELEQLTPIADVAIGASSNGFLGNMHELTASTADTPEPLFKAELNSRRDLNGLVDGQPDTWIEYEAWLVSDADRRTAGNFGFTYQRDTTDGTTYVDWAAGPPGGVLRLVVDFDLRTGHPINFVSLVPFNLEDNANYPIKVVGIDTSRDGTQWEPVRPQNIYVGTTANLQSARVADDVIVGEAVWAFTGRVARYVRCTFEQANHVTSKLGHPYYLDKNGNRVDVPAPLESDPMSVYDPTRRVAGQLSQHREVFSAKRWAIGLRDITISHINYAAESVLVTRPLRVGGVVDRVSLEAEITIPPEYDDSQTWVTFFVSPDNGTNWFPISRVQDDYLGLPEILAFNDPLPVEFQESGVGYHNVPGAVTTLRLKIVLRRPSDLPATTPVLHSYQLTVRRG